MFLACDAIGAYQITTVIYNCGVIEDHFNSLCYIVTLYTLMTRIMRKLSETSIGKLSLWLRVHVK